MIPGADCSRLHPVLYARLDHALNDPLIAGRVRVVSATRTRAEQQALYAAWLAGQGNTAANPDGRTRGRYGLVWRYGSWHMVQPETGYGYAVDLNWSELDPRTAALTERILTDHRLERTVTEPQFEPWHWQMTDDITWTPTTGDDDMTDDDRKLLKDVAQDVADIKHQLWNGPRKPRRTVREVLSELIDRD